MLTHGRFSVSENDLIVSLYPTTMVTQIAATLERTVFSVRTQVRKLRAIGRIQCYRRERPWTPEEDDRLMDYYGVIADGQLAIHLSRTLKAMNARANVLGFCRRDNYWSARAVSRLFGVSEETSIRWIKLRLLRSRWRIIGEGRTSYGCQAADIERFIRRYPHWYDYRRMETRTHFRALAEKVWIADPLLTLAQAAARVGAPTPTVKSWVWRGRLPAVKGGMTPGGRWYVKTSDLMAYVAEQKSARKGADVVLNDSGALDAQNRVYGAETGVLKGVAA